MIETDNQKGLTDNQVEVRRVLRQSYIEKCKLNGVEISDEMTAMFDLMDDEAWPTDKCIKFVREVVALGGFVNEPE